ncbi:MAG: hypothetical protein H7Z17_20995 [Fuerstia sp.]|nr:hypothetical protein [Fuerstiella sp.]
MLNENSLPDELRGLIEKRSAKDRRKKAQGRLSDDDDGRAAEAARKPQRDRRQQKNFRDLLDEDDE